METEYRVGIELAGLAMKNNVRSSVGWEQTSKVVVVPQERPDRLVAGTQQEDMSALMKRIHLNAREMQIERLRGQAKLLRQSLPCGIEHHERQKLTGQRYFESCWAGQDAELNESCVDVAVKTIPETGHDGVLLKLTVLKQERYWKWPL